MRRAFVSLALLLLLALPGFMPALPVPAQTSATLYAPTIASPNSTLVGTTGPNGSVSIDFHETNNREERSSVSADSSGRFVLRAPAAALGVDFSVAGVSRHCVISANRKVIAGGLTPRRAVSGALAIVAAQTAYDIHQPALLQVEHFDPLKGSVLLDDGPIQLLAGSDRSVVALLHESITLGRHGIGISSNGHAVEVQADIVKTSLSVTGPSDYRVPRTVTLYVDGLNGDRASVLFDVTGGAVLANNKDEIEVPVTPPGQATTSVKANQPGQVNLKWKLNVGLDLKYRFHDYGIPVTYETPPQNTVAPTPLIPCTIRLTDGWFEAVQGPFQDDPIFTQKPEHLVREDGNTISYFGQLSMIKNRPSALIGVQQYYKDGNLVNVGSRNVIEMKGETNCSEYEAVKIRFTLHEAGQGPRIIYTSPIAGYIFFKGHAEAKYTPWQASVQAFNGVPETPFVFTSGANHYAIDAELVDARNNPLGMKMWLNGYTEVTNGPLVRLLPLLLSHSKSDALTQERQDGLVSEGKRLKTELFEHIPDVYPLRPHGLPMPIVAEPLDLSGKAFDSKWDDAISFDVTIRERYHQNVQAGVDDRFATTTVLDGASRTVALLVSSDFDKLVGPGALGYTMSTKLVAVKWTEPWTTAGHELAHTMPQFLWSSTQMTAQCDKDYHNKFNPIAFGLQTMKLSNPITPEQRYGYPFDLMQGAGDEAWVSQCTYDNLITALRGDVDPQVLLLRFYLAQPVHGGVVGKLRPAYVTHATLSQTVKDGAYSVTAYGAGGVIERGKFSPQWVDENNFNRNIISVQYRLKYDPSITRIDLRGPKGELLDSMSMSKSAPAVTITHATFAGRRVSVAWRGSGEAGRELLYSVFLSHDRKVFDEFSFERPESSATFILRRHSHLRPRFVKVIVTDGSRSTEVIAPLR